MSVFARSSSGIRRWLDASIHNRIRAVVLLLTLGVLASAAILNYLYVAQLMERQAQGELAAHGREFSSNLERDLTSLLNHLHLISLDTSVLAAFRSSREGRETHLYARLQHLKQEDIGWLRNLCIVTREGHAIACVSSPGPDYTRQAWLSNTLEKGQPTARLAIDAPAPSRLGIAYPVFGPDGVSGAVVGELFVEDLVARETVASRLADHVHVFSPLGDLFMRGSYAETIHATRALDLPAPLGELKLMVGLGYGAKRFYAPLHRLTALYGLVALLFVLIAFFAVQWATPQLTARLKALALTADRVAEGDNADFTPHLQIRDEIGKTAEAIATMAQRLREQQQDLEHQVIERTSTLQQKEAMMQAIVDAVPGAIFQYRLRPDGSSHFPFISRAVGGLFGLRPNKIREDATAAFARVHPDDLAELKRSIDASARQLVPWQHEYRVIQPDDGIRWLFGNALPQREADGATLWHGIITDITEHKRAELALSDSEAYSKALFAHSYIPLVILDPATGRFIDCNDAAVAIYRLRNRLDVMGRALREVSPPVQYDGTPTDEAARQLVGDTCAEGVAIREWRHQRPDGELWDAEIRCIRFRHNNRDLLQLALRDITAQKRSEAEIWHQANHDKLTGLANRGLCHDRLEHAIAHARRHAHKVGALFIDLDGFKDINDRHGHAAGDELLVQVALRLENCIREQDTSCRLGGDEFVFVVSDITDREDLLRIAAETVATLNRPFGLAAGTVTISGSIGIAVFPDDADTAADLLDCADRALYSAKRAGKNRHAFYSPG